MRNYFKFLIVLSALLILNEGRAYAQIAVDNVIVHLALGSRPVHNVIVRNSSPNTAYVITEVTEVPDPAKDPTKNVPTSDLLASPKAFSIEPNGERTVRLLLKTPPGDIEKVFRVAFVPQDKGFGEEVEQKVGTSKAIIRVLSGMGILVFVDPKVPQVKLEWERTANKIILKNTGTVQIYLGDAKSCDKSNNCTGLISKRLYAGSTYEITAPPENTVSFLRQDGASGDYQKLTIEPKK